MTDSQSASETSRPSTPTAPDSYADTDFRPPTPEAEEEVEDLTGDQEVVPKTKTSLRVPVLRSAPRPVVSILPGVLFAGYSTSCLASRTLPDSMGEV